MINTNPLVSIIVNCHNGEIYLKECINSLLQQSYKNIEIIFFNNFSNDNSYKVIKKFNDRRIKIFQSKKLLSLPVARNEAIKKSNGVYIAILDTDDLSLPDRIKKQVYFMNKNQNYGLISANCNFINANGKIIKQTNIPTNTIDIMKKIYWSYTFNNPLLFFRKDLLNKVGGYPIKFKFINDYVLVHKILKVSKIGNLAEILGSYRIHNESLTNKYFIRMEIELLFFLFQLLVYKKNFTRTITFYYIIRCILRIILKFLKIYK